MDNNKKSFTEKFDELCESYEKKRSEIMTQFRKDHLMVHSDFEDFITLRKKRLEDSRRELKETYEEFLKSYEALEKENS